MHERLEKIAEELQQADLEMTKTVKGNGAAGTRVRKHLQSIKKMAQSLRNDILDLRKKKGKKI